mmetsp:Transcript_90677/g.180325  ORF Transcript_90677/g.180325 Transcript_90677/m.180325 type:complete len:233 (+) Transcript_90677:226-924(+)
MRRSVSSPPCISCSRNSGFAQRKWPTPLPKSIRLSCSPALSDDSPVSGFANVAKSGGLSSTFSNCAKGAKTMTKPPAPSLMALQKKSICSEPPNCFNRCNRRSTMKPTRYGAVGRAVCTFMKKPRSSGAASKGPPTSTKSIVPPRYSLYRGPVAESRRSRGWLANDPSLICVCCVCLIELPTFGFWPTSTIISPGKKSRSGPRGFNNHTSFRIFSISVRNQFSMLAAGSRIH